MADWKPLPDELDLDTRNLVEQLRRLKDRSGLSLVALADRTLHSKSSWERYLNGKTLPPRQAIESLVLIVGADPDRLTALWYLAEHSWSCRETAGPKARRPEPAATANGTGTGTAAAPRGARIRRAAMSVWSTRRRTAAAAAVLVAAGAVLVGLRAVSDNGPPAHSPDRPNRLAAGGTSGTAPLDTTCFEDSCTGKDPKQAHCADAWTAALGRTHGVYVELRYSDACKAAWARISWGRTGDIAEVVAVSGARRHDRVHYDTDVYSPMVAADTPSDAKACTTLTSGAHDCTDPGGTIHLTEPPEPTP
ncbi:DUF2690 domain-containing protein [Streptomyces sp. NPDC051639]|uniref:helix-turn-helix domain-containing protein n=1 Tax=Streptomyces sp. NPDC051639 TaxID=3155671 RepID=UPI0034451520